MSDETRKFDLPGDENPTELLAAPGTAPVDTSSTSRSRTRVVVLAVIGGLLLAALAVVLILLLSRGSATPTAAPASSPSAAPAASPASTPRATPSTSAAPEPTSTPAPPPTTGAAIESFESSTPTVSCNSAVPSPQYVSFSWSSTGVNTVEFGVVESGTSTVYFSNLPPSGDNSDFPGDNSNFAYGCPQATITYYLRVVGPDGQEDLDAVTIENIGNKS